MKPIKITKRQLKKIIKEELENVMSEILPREGAPGLPDLDPQKALQLICGVKPAILIALNRPKFGRVVLEAIFVKKGGEWASYAIQLVKTFEEQTGMKVEDILKIPFAKMIVQEALGAICK